MVVEDAPVSENGMIHNSKRGIKRMCGGFPVFASCITGVEQSFRSSRNVQPSQTKPGRNRRVD